MTQQSLVNKLITTEMNAESQAIIRESLGGNDIKVMAEEMYPDFITEVVYRTAARPPLAPRNEDDKKAQDFIKAASNASTEKLVEKLIVNLGALPAVAAQAVCRNLINSAVFWYISEHNRAQRLEETKAKMGITDTRGIPEAAQIFGKYEGAEAETPEISLPVLALLTDMLYLELAEVYAEAAPVRPVTRFSRNQTPGILPYATRRDPVSGDYVNFHTLEDAVEGLERMRAMAAELLKHEQTHSRASKGDAMDFGTAQAATKEPTAAVADALDFDE